MSFAAKVKSQFKDLTILQSVCEKMGVKCLLGAEATVSAGDPKVLAVFSLGYSLARVYQDEVVYDSDYTRAFVNITNEYIGALCEEMASQMVGASVSRQTVDGGVLFEIDIPEQQGLVR